MGEGGGCGARGGAWWDLGVRVGNAALGCRNRSCRGCCGLISIVGAEPRHHSVDPVVYLVEQGVGGSSEDGWEDW
jgi:hypothetical protein